MVENSSLPVAGETGSVETSAVIFMMSRKKNENCQLIKETDAN